MNRTRHFLPALAFGAFAGTAFAHDGHGLPGAHWHATDTLGLLLVAALAVGAAAWWASRGGK